MLVELWSVNGIYTSPVYKTKKNQGKKMSNPMKRYVTWNGKSSPGILLIQVPNLTSIVGILAFMPADTKAMLLEGQPIFQEAYKSTRLPYGKLSKFRYSRILYFLSSSLSI